MLHKVCRADSIQSGKSHRTKVGRWEISVFNVDGTFYAIKDICPHQEVSLSTGTVEGTVVTCPGHVWQFDLRDGQYVDGDTEVVAKTFPIEVTDGEIYVEV